MAMNAEIIFQPLLGQIFNSDASASGIEVPVRLVLGAISFLFWVGSMAGTICLIHFFLTLPMRRMERARLFLDLLESALNRGQSVEEMILSIAQSRDRILGVRFHLLAAHIESGLRFARRAGKSAALFAAANFRHAPRRRKTGRPPARVAGLP